MVEENDSDLPQHFQISIVIWEGRHLALTNANTDIKISLGNRRKTIKAKTNSTDSPYFNDFCSFHFYLPLNVLLDKILVIKVFQISRLIRKFVGSFSVELATVWAQPDHQFHRKWAVLTNPNIPTLGVRGFLKCDIAVLTKGVYLKAPPIDFTTDEKIEENILVPHEGTQDRHSINVIFSVFRADGFSPYLKKINRAKLTHPYIKITCGGVVQRTMNAFNPCYPEWNQQIIFADFFPPLFQNIFIELCNQGPLGSKSLGNTSIDITSLYEDGPFGFLPTFGPTFLYLYQPFKKFQYHTNGSIAQRSFTYICRLLIAMRTEVSEVTEESSNKKKKEIKKIKMINSRIPPIIENDYFEYKKFILFAAIFDVLMFDAKRTGKKISFQITFGPKENKGGAFKDDDDEDELFGVSSKKKVPDDLHVNTLELFNQLKAITSCSTTYTQKTQVKAEYGFYAYTGKFPCIHVFGEWPDSLRKMYRTNIIKKIIQKCTNDMNNIKKKLMYEKDSQVQSFKKLKSILRKLSKSCEKLLSSSAFDIKFEDTNLIREKKKFYKKKISEITKKTKRTPYSKNPALAAEETIRKISFYLTALTKFAQDPENSFPDTEIWVKRNKRLTAQHRIKTEDLAYSSDFRERGIWSGVPQTLVIESKKKKATAKIDVFLWFGLVDDFKECLKMLPQGYSQDFVPCPSNVELKVPTSLYYEEKHTFECKAHLYLGKIMIGYDQTGLADPYVKVIVKGQNKTTRVRRGTLSPMWDQTLVFPEIVLHGPLSYIKKYPTTVTVEVFDKNLTRKSELIGRCFVKPVVKLKNEKYKPPNFTPKLRWEDIKYGVNEVGKILMVVEFLELSGILEDQDKKDFQQLSIPENIKPHKVKYQLEIFFWGVRPVKNKGFKKKKMMVVIECGEKLIQSPVLSNAKRAYNFMGTFEDVEINLPEEAEYAPPLTLKLFHGINSPTTYMATCIVPTVRHFFVPFVKRSRDKKFYIYQLNEDKLKKKPPPKTKRMKWVERRRKLRNCIYGIIFAIVKFYRFLKCKMFYKCQESAYELPPSKEPEALDWWSRYHASFSEDQFFEEVPRLTIFSEELESQPQFGGFRDILHTFDMAVGYGNKRRGPILKAKFKAVLRLYKLPNYLSRPEENTSEDNIDENRMVIEKLSQGTLPRVPSNDTLKFVARVYVVSGKNLAPKDIYGKSDPYLLLELGDQKVSDRQNYISKQLNPTFGKCFEFLGAFPHDYLLRIKVIDYDAHSKDDLIGETFIDIESRYYSKHHATCGLAKQYEKRGVNAWRDIYRPSDILGKMCSQLSLSSPIYEPNRVRIEEFIFSTPGYSQEMYKREHQALEVLNRWHKTPLIGFQFVPEHVETRSLYRPDLPGIEQGKLELWIDIFPADYRYMPPMIDITPRPAVPMELRAIVWNVDDVVLDDKSFFFNEKMSDIYLRGWILSLEEQVQRTDIHYRSLNGQGNFNWRFIFHFNYIATERMMVIKKKMHAFDYHPEEKKSRCKLEIQIWDNDAFGDDYLGTLILELCAMPRGAKLSSQCNLKILAPNESKINLFKIRKTRGWWPFRRINPDNIMGNEFQLSGKIDMELEILTEAEAKLHPAGKGREGPDALPPPKRPETSFNWFLNPVKTFRYIILTKLARLIAVVFFILLVLFFIITGLYAIPNYTVKKILHA